MTPFETILCPVDPAAPSDGPLQYAMALGGWFAAPVTVLAIRPHQWRAARMPATGRDGDRPEADASAFVQRIRQVVGPSVTLQVAEGAVGREVIRAARDLQADLVVMGARDPGRLERLLFGSVLEHVLTHIGCPGLIVPLAARVPPPPPAALFERIVCGVDRSRESHRALAYALSLGTGHLAVVHAPEDFSDEDPRFAGHFNTVECWREVAPDLKARYEELVPEEARLWCDVEVEVPFGRAGSVVIDAADARQASLIVIGTAGFHSPYGATARHVIQHARCPVLAVPRAVTRGNGRPRPLRAAADATIGGE
jgi:nucleotide-binding universal stress UspA family protein